jgi:hypothetical protein
MSTTYSLKAFASSYSLSIEQLFDRSWMLYDVTKLRILHLGNPITFIHDGNQIPEFFEYRKPGVNGHQVRGSFMNQVHDLTVNKRDIQAWFDAATGNRDQRATNPYRSKDLCTYGHTWFETILATMKSPNSLLCWHITNRNQQIEDIKNPPPTKEAKPSFFDNIKKKLFA